MLGSNPSAWQDSAKKSTGKGSYWLPFLFLENKSDKSRGLGQSPKVFLLMCKDVVFFRF